MAKKRRPRQSPEGTNRAPKGAGSIEQRPNGKWRVIVSAIDPMTGKRKKLSRTFDTQREAVDYKEDAEGILKKRLRASGVDRSRKLTLADWLDEWLQLKKGKIEDGSWAWYESQVRRHLNPVVGVLRIEDVDSLHVERFMAALRTGGGTLGKPVSVYGQRAALTTLRAALNDAVRHKLIDTNPTQPVKKPKRTHRVPKWWSAEDASRFLNHDAVGSHRLFALFRLALDSGMRLGELFALKWPDVDLAARTAHVCRSLEEVAGVFKEKAPKTRAGDRRVILSKETVDALADHRRAMLAEGRDVQDGTVFISEVGAWLDKPNFYRMFHRLIKRAAATKIRPYDLRHSAASMWLTNGASIVAVAARLGHEDPAMTLRHYAHCLPSEQGTIAAMASRLLA